MSIATCVCKGYEISALLTQLNAISTAIADISTLGTTTQPLTAAVTFSVACPGAAAVVGTVNLGATNGAVATVTYPYCIAAGATADDCCAGNCGTGTANATFTVCSLSDPTATASSLSYWTSRAAVLNAVILNTRIRCTC